MDMSYERRRQSLTDVIDSLRREVDWMEAQLEEKISQRQQLYYDWPACGPCDCGDCKP